MLDEDREKVLFLCLLDEGDLVLIRKDRRVARYVVMVDGELHLLAADFEDPVLRYLQGKLSVIQLVALTAEER